VAARDNRRMSVPARQLLQAFDALLQPERFKDYGPNGLQVEGKAQIARMVSGVTASRALIEAAIARRPTPSLCTTACSGVARTAASPAG
jgi:hypothetical protein